MYNMAQFKIVVCVVTRKVVLKRFMKKITIISFLKRGIMHEFYFIFLKTQIFKQWELDIFIMGKI